MSSKQSRKKTFCYYYNMTSTQCEPGANFFGGNTYYCHCTCHQKKYGLWLMVIQATFKNISVISWLSVLLVEDTGVPRENHRPDELYRIMLYRVHLANY